MIRKIITYPDPLLTQVAKSVIHITDEIRTLLNDMAETMYAGEGVGLAAPQVAVGLRAIVIDVDVEAGEKGPGLLKMVNPEIVAGDGEIEWEEGCLSVPDFRIKIKRKGHLRVKYLTENGEEIFLECEGLLAVAVQHEIDHLDGKLIIDDASRLKRDLYRRKLRKKHTEDIDF
jgi:peptide deformylase